MDVGEVGAPLLPSRCNEVAADEAQQALPVARRARSQEDIGLIDAVDGAIRRQAAPDDVGEARQEVHDGEHGI